MEAVKRKGRDSKHSEKPKKRKRRHSSSCSSSELSDREDSTDSSEYKRSHKSKKKRKHSHKEPKVKKHNHKKKRSHHDSIKKEKPVVARTTEVTSVNRDVPPPPPARYEHWFITVPPLSHPHSLVSPEDRWLVRIMRSSKALLDECWIQKQGDTGTASISLHCCCHC